MREASAALKEQVAPASASVNTGIDGATAELVEPSVPEDAMQQLQDMGFPRNRQDSDLLASCIMLSSTSCA